MAQNYTFLFWQKSLDIKIMLHEDILYRKYIQTYYWLVICIAKNFI